VRIAGLRPFLAGIILQVRGQLSLAALVADWSAYRRIQRITPAQVGNE